jgi:hypothetical protein
MVATSQLQHNVARFKVNGNFVHLRHVKKGSLRRKEIPLSRFKVKTLYLNGKFDKEARRIVEWKTEDIKIKNC